MWSKTFWYRCRSVHRGVAHLMAHYDKDFAQAPPAVRIKGLPFEVGKDYEMTFLGGDYAARDILGV